MGGWAPKQNRPGPPGQRAHSQSVSSRSKPHVHTDLSESPQWLALCLVAGTRGSQAAFSPGPRAPGAHSARRRKREQGTGLGQQGRLVLSLAVSVTGRPRCRVHVLMGGCSLCGNGSPAWRQQLL